MGCLKIVLFGWLFLFKNPPISLLKTGGGSTWSEVQRIINLRGWGMFLKKECLLICKKIFDIVSEIKRI